MEVIKYSSEYKQDWNNFISSAKNATFLFYREFMEYHKDRFVDYSLLIYKEGKLVGVLPCSVMNNQVTSHGGLTYGGLVVNKNVKLLEYIKIFQSILKFLYSQGVDSLVYKAIPSIYCEQIAQEQEYVMFLLKARNIRVDTSTTVMCQNSFKFQTRRKRSINKAKKNNLIIREESTFDQYWNDILAPNLKEKYNKKPVHNLEEITTLKKSFQNYIKQYNVYKDKQILAGVTVFETNKCAHAQYISSNQIGREIGALDLLFDYLILNEFKDKEYFDFGISNEDEGLKVNKGLLSWKEGFGGITVVHKFYSISVSNYHFLDSVLSN